MERIREIREQFPALQQQVYGRQLIYFDNAATAQKPQSAISLIDRMNSLVNANIHRAVHKLSSDATQLYEEGRDAVRKFINAEKREEVVFTSGTTAAINLVAYTFAERYLKPGDEILLTEGEHHSNMVPWQIVCMRKGATVKYLPIDENGCWEMDKLDNLLGSGKVRLVSAAHISNVLGVVNPIKELITKAHNYGAMVLIDGAQGVVHDDVDVKSLDCDFYTFSGHKIYAATGIGILYGKEKILDELPPWMGGGDMVDTVTYDKTTYAALPLKFEAGTPNFIGAASFKPALDFAIEMRDGKIVNYEREIVDYLNKNFNLIEGLKTYGISDRKVPLFSFVVEGVHHSDLAQILDKMGIAVRSGLMCAEPLINKYGHTGMIRVSLAPYNTMDECGIFIEALKKGIKMLR